ncbi:hypothetical protein EMCRGX_G011704 [Ephydatia muelleri]
MCRLAKLSPAAKQQNTQVSHHCAKVNLPVLQQSNIMYYVVFKFLLPVVLIKELSDLLDQIWYEHKWGSPQFFSTRGLILLMSLAADRCSSCIVQWTRTSFSIRSTRFDAGLMCIGSHE